MTDLGIKLKKLLLDIGITQIELCEKTGIKRASMSNYINGRRSMPYDVAKKIAKELKVNTEFVLDESMVIPTRKVPVVGYDNECADYSKSLDIVEVPDTIYKKRLYAIELTDDLDDIKKGVRLVCDPEAEIINNKYVHYCMNNGTAGIKKVEMTSSHIMLHGGGTDAFMVDMDSNEIKLSLVVARAADVTLM